MRPHHRTAGLLLALVAIVFGVFFNTLEAGFLRWDDDINVFENPHVQGLTAANLRWMFTDFEQAIRYKPLSWLAWALVYECFGLNSFGYHLANVLLHCVNSVLVFLLLRRLLQLSAQANPAPAAILKPQTSDLKSPFSPDSCAALGTLIWAVHPLRVEPVAWVTGLPYGLSLLFLLLATLSYLRAHSPGLAAPQQRQAYWLSVGIFALAVLAYPIVLGFVAALLALDFYPLRRWTSFTELRRMIWEKIPFLALSLLLVAGTVYGRFHVTGTWDKPVTLDNFPPFARAMQAGYLWAYYAWKPLVPLNLCPVYPLLMESRFTEPVFVLSAVAVVMTTATLFAKRLSWPGAFALWLAHLGLLVPMLGLTERPHYSHDRYSIIDGILWSVAMTGVLWQLAQKRVRPAGLLAGGVAVTMLLAVMSWRQTAIWHRDLTFFSDMAAKLRSPHYRSQALLKIGNAHADLEDDAAAVASYRDALALSPSSATFQLHYNLGNALARLAQWNDAAISFEAALRLKPDHAGAHLNYGIAASAQGNLPRAIEHLLRAVELQPNSAEAHAQLAEAFTKQGKPDLAREHAAAAERLKAQTKP
ncbi:MAG: tetratricopeptide repeat protein [Verrucomicrobia bacterium]|nr:tetratricopeptide repeat protein [Verrucomicrobiota bacterium]NDD39177.1 tetratricopeptide repeat protein [Verrucomicrobiota bacterium]NDE99209.1 tetratricopeptide repeat protein [Verrucomicrobiota bacterium]